MHRVAALLLALCITAAVLPARAGAQTVPADRTFVAAWHDAGSASPIPDRPVRSVREFGAVGDGVADDTPAIRAAIDWVAEDPDFGTVFFPAGTYRVTTTLTLPSSISLRGERDESGNRALLRFDLGGASAHSIHVSGSGGGAWQAAQPATIHSRTMAVTDASAFSVGDYVEVRQDNAPSWDTGYGWGDHAIGQVLRITAVEVETNRLHFEHELRADYASKLQPEIRRLSMKTGVGIEDLAIERVDSIAPAGGSMIRFDYAADSWVRGVESSRCVQRHVEIRHSTDVSVTGSYFHDAFAYGGGGSAYGVELSFHSGQCLVEDNIFRHLRHAMLVQVGSNGNVFGYNYSREATRTEFPSNFASDIACHGHMPHANLFEGNIVSFIWFDTSHGESAGSYNTLFRNASTVRGIWMRSSLGARSCDNQNIVGNDSLTGVNRIAGAGHLQWGNRIASGGAHIVTPAGTDHLPDRSYYLSLDPQAAVTPSWWTIESAPPTIGPGSTLAWRAPNNPARARWDGKGPKTVGAHEPPPHTPGRSVLYLPAASMP